MEKKCEAFRMETFGMSPYGPLVSSFARLVAGEKHAMGIFGMVYIYIYPLEISLLRR